MENTDASTFKETIDRNMNSNNESTNTSTNNSAYDDDNNNDNFYQDNNNNTGYNNYSNRGYNNNNSQRRDRDSNYQQRQSSYRRNNNNSQDYSGKPYQPRIHEIFQDELKPYESTTEIADEDKIVPVTDFENMGLNENLYRGIISYGFEKPTLVQSYGIPLFDKKRDTIIQSQSGTGKTATFLMGALNKINVNEFGCQVIVIAPTRELAKQISSACTNLSCYTKIKTLLCVKEKTMIPYNQIKGVLHHNPCIVIATPGKLCSFLKNSIISTNKLKCLILDEADELLSSGFINTIKEIYCMTPETSRTYLLSATMSQNFISITQKFMRDPIIHVLKPEQLTLEGIKQYYFWLKNNDAKFNFLLDIYDKLSISQSIIYVNSANTAKELEYRLNDENFATSIIYGALSVEERDQVMKNFRSGKSRILVSTDLLSRGIDVQQIAVVINYELPFDGQLDSYIHRIGRSGRFGRKGTAINFVTDRDMYKIEKIEKIYKTQILPLPNDIENIL